MATSFPACWMDKKQLKTQVESYPAQIFDYLLVLDFEATCDSPKQLEPQEIIEFPVICLETPSMATVSTFHQYVKPKINPELTAFCTDFTGIQQSTLDQCDHFDSVLTKFDQWIRSGFELADEASGGKRRDNFAFVTCGNWDLRKAMPVQCDILGLTIPNYMRQWINVKKSYTDVVRRWPRDMTDMAIELKVPLVGRQHSGIDDCLNIANIVRELAKRGYIFKKTNQL